MAQSYRTLSREQLERILDAEAPRNDQREGGYALVNVLDRDAYEKEHIPGSINIPRARIQDFARRFDRSKNIIVYCASVDCAISPRTASDLSQRGFERVYEYEGGMKEWKAAKNPVAGKLS